MNKFNLKRLSKFGVLAEITSTDRGHPVITINLPARLGNLGFEGAPTVPFELDEFSAATSHLTDGDLREFKEKDESVQATQPVTTALARQSAKVAAANADVTLAGPGKLKVAVAAMEASLTTMGRQFALLTRMEADQRRQYDQLYAVPQPDAVDVVVDVEIRGEFRRLSDQDQHLRVLKLGEDQRFITALKRSPLPFVEVVANCIRDIWVNQIALKNPEKAATLKLSMDCNDWARRFTKQLAGFAASAALSGTNGEVDRFRCYQILKPTGGFAVLAFTDHEIMQFERRLQQAAA